jgi:hypothetical protein
MKVTFPKLTKEEVPIGSKVMVRRSLRAAILGHKDTETPE